MKSGLFIFLIVNLFLFLINIFFFYRNRKAKHLVQSLKQTELDDSEDKVHFLLDATPLSVILIDKNFKCVYVNEEAVRMNGINNKQEYMEMYSQGRLILERGGEFLREAFIKGYWRGNLNAKRPDGEVVPCEITLIRLNYKGDYAIAGYARDLRGEIAAAKKIRKTEEEKQTIEEAHSLLRNILDIMPVSVIITRRGDGGLLYANKVALDTFACESFEKDALTRKSLDFMPEIQPDGKKTKDVVAELWEQNEDVREFQFKRLNGSVFPGRLAFCYINYFDAEASLNVIEDITEEKNSLANLENILNGLDTMIYVTDPHTDKILFINDKMVKHFNIENNCIGDLCYKIFRKDIDERCGFCPCSLLNSGFKEEVQWEETNPLTKRIYSNTDRYIDWPNGKKAHLQHSIDITELKEAEREIAEKKNEIEAALHKAENANRAKSVFLATISHEIRTPMNAILGITEMQLQTNSLSFKTREALERIYNSGNLLLNIINDILDLSKIEAGKLEIAPNKYDILSLINDTVQMNWLRYESKPIEFLLDIDENTPLNLFGDELRIRQVLNNIMSNAFKYTDKGTVKLSVSFEPSHEGNTVIMIFIISDTGQGMTQDQLERIFDEYARFNLETNRTIMGVGLGMNITKRLLDLMNGEIEITSEKGKGSVFTVRLPQKRVDSAVCGKDTAEKMRKSYYQSGFIANKSRVLCEYMPYGSVLVVDDLEMNIFVTKGMLAPYGLKVDSATSGLEAIEKIKAGNSYDIIFMDHMMPKMDGIETVRLIREWEKTINNDCPLVIIALTANALVGQADMFLENGFDGYLSKPIDSRELNQILIDFIRNKKPPEIVAAARKERMSMNKVYNDFETARLFIIDAENSVKTLEGIRLEPEKINDEDIELYGITVHGVKNILYSIGETELSSTAYTLEKAAKNRDIAVLEETTPAFLDAIRFLIEKFKTIKEAGKEESSQISDEDKLLLLEKLKMIKTACDSFDSNAARKALDELKMMSLPHTAGEILDEISNLLMESSFKKTSSLIDEYLEKYAIM